MRFERVVVGTGLENVGILSAEELAEAEVKGPFSKEDVLIMVDGQSGYRLMAQPNPGL